MKTIEPTVALALSRFFAKAGKGAELDPGVHKIAGRFTVDVTGELVKGEDEEYIPTTSIPTKALLALLLPHLGESREKALQVLGDAMALAVHADVKADAVLASATVDVAKQMDRVTRLTGTIPAKVRAGKVKADVDVAIS